MNGKKLTTWGEYLADFYAGYMRDCKELTGRGVMDFLALSNFLHGSF